MPEQAIEEPWSRRRALEAVGYLGVRAVADVLGRLPWHLALAVGSGGGALYGALARLRGAKAHRVARRNLEIAFPERSREEREALRRAMWRTWGRAMADVAKLPRLEPSALRELVRLDPPEAPEEIFRRAREGGALVLTAHFGSFELLHAACAAYGYPITLVHRTLPNRYVDRWLTTVRERAGARVLRRGSAARQVLRSLRDGCVVAVPFDQRARGGAAVFAPLFGLPAATHSGLARVALASRAPIFSAVLVRDDASARHRAVFGGEIALPRTGDRESDVREGTRRLNSVLEALIRQHPDHWIWMYSRWKRQPGELGSPYWPDAPPVEEIRRLATATATANEIGIALPRRTASRPSVWQRPS